MAEYIISMDGKSQYCWDIKSPETDLDTEYNLQNPSRLL